MYIQDMLDKAEKLQKNIPEMVFDVILDNDVWILDLNREQLMEGKTAENEDVSPKYSEDPYFKKEGAAERYIAWKSKITPNPKRNPDAPNLFIDGTFHATFKLSFEGDDIVVTSDSQISRDVSRKFANIFGLTDDNLIELWNQKVCDYIVDKFINN